MLEKLVNFNKQFLAVVFYNTLRDFIFEIFRYTKYWVWIWYSPNSKPIASRAISQREDLWLEIVLLKLSTFT